MTNTIACPHCHARDKKGRTTMTVRGCIGTAGRLRAKCRKCGRTTQLKAVYHSPSVINYDVLSR